MPRVTDEDVNAVHDFGALDLAPYITIANLVVDKHLVGGQAVLSDAELFEIERYLSAHFATMVHPELVGAAGFVTSESIGDASKSFSASATSPPNLGSLVLTRFGQIALLLDRSGTLPRLGRERVIMESL